MLFWLLNLLLFGRPRCRHRRRILRSLLTVSSDVSLLNNTLRARSPFQDKRWEPREIVEARGKAVRGVVKALALALAFPLTCRSRATSRDMLVTRVAPAEQTGTLAPEPLVLRLLGAAAVMTNMWKIHL